MNWYRKIFADGRKTIWKPDPETVELIKKLYSPELGAEHSIAGVARTIGAYPKTLTRWLKDNNLYQEVGSYYTGWKPRDESESNLIKQLYLLPPEGQGKTTGQISKITNIPEHSLSVWLKNQKLYRYSNYKNKFNPSEGMKEKIKKMYMLPPEGDGLGIKTIARKIGISHPALTSWFIREGIELRTLVEQRNTPYQKENAQKKLQEWGKTQRLLSEDDVDYLVSLYNEGYSTLDIADAFGIQRSTVLTYLQRRNVQTRTAPEATRLEKSRQKSREDTLKYWETHDFWERMATFPLEKRYNIIAGIASQRYFANDLERLNWIGAMRNKAKSIGANPENPHSTPTAHAPYASGNEVEGNATSNINMNWFKKSSVTHESISKGIYIKPLLSNGEIEIWLVKGDLVRNNYSIDFTLGGHDKVYKFIPLNEVWIDDSTSEDERGFTIVHELRERRIMLEGKGYEEAHRQANILEILCRRNKICVKEMIDKELDKNKREIV